MKYFLGIMGLLIFISACTPVRYKVFNKSKKSGVMIIDTAAVNEDNNSGYHDPYKDYRYTDTTYIDVEANKALLPLGVQGQFEQALRQFDEENYEESCQVFRQLSTTINPDDSLYFESFFYCAECRILDDKLEKAEEILTDLISNQKTPEAVIERCLVRLGQIYCVTERKKQAYALFDRLKKEYPNSIYIKIANCDVVN